MENQFCEGKKELSYLQILLPITSIMRENYQMVGHYAAWTTFWTMNSPKRTLLAQLSTQTPTRLLFLPRESLSFWGTQMK